MTKELETATNEHIHMPLRVTPLRIVSGGVDLYLHQCHCEAWRVRLNDQDHSWQQNWKSDQDLSIEDAKETVADLPHNAEGYGAAVALAVHHSGVRPKNATSEEEFGKDITE